MTTDRTAPKAPGLLIARLLLVGASVLMGPTSATAQIQPLDSIVAVVNNDVIVESELEGELALVRPQLEAAGTAIPDQATLEQEVLDRLIAKRLQMQRAEALGIEVDDDELTQAMASIANRNGLSLEGLQEALTANGIAFSDFRDDTRMQILTSRLQQQEVIQKIRVTDPEVDRFLEQESDALIDRSEVRLQHILIAVPDPATPQQVEQAEAEARTLAGRLRKGADFSQLARTHSDGGRAADGGDLGWFPVAEVPSLAVEPANNLAKGEVSDPIRSPSGYHLIRVSDIRGAEPEPLTQIHARHILIRPNEVVSDEDAKRRLERLRLRIQGGDDFATLARSHSDDTGSALNGGDLGWVSPGETVPQFEEVMTRLEPNQVSQPFQSPFGWHIVQVLERRRQDTRDEVMRLRAKDAIRQRKAEEATELWLQQLRDEAYVELRLNDAFAD
jgi:peptidyl-prolyl cis-trans isomerase SurA